MPPRLSNLPSNVTRLIGSKLNAASLARFAVAYKHANVRNMVNKAREAQEDELRRIVTAAAIFVLDDDERNRSALSSSENYRDVARQLGLEYKYAGTPGMSGERYYIRFTSPWQYDEYDVVLFDKLLPERHQELAAFRINHNWNGDRRPITTGWWSDTNPDVAIIRRVVGNINQKLSNARNRTNRARTPPRTRSPSPVPVRTWRAPTVPSTGPEQFVRNVQNVVPNSRHIASLRRAVAGQRLPTVAKAVYRILKNQGGWNARNLARSANVLKAWRAYERWHANHAPPAAPSGKKRKRASR